MKESLKQIREGFRTETLTLCNIGKFEENHYFVTQVHMFACQIYRTFMLVCKRYSILARFVDFLLLSPFWIDIFWSWFIRNWDVCSLIWTFQ